jgi:soluble lytic murein transglycosylase
VLSRYRETLRGWTAPIGYALFRLHLRPNHLTLAGLGVSLLAASAFVTGRTRSAGFLLILAGLFDFFDGSLARASGQVTPFGAFLDSVIDRYSDLVVLLGIVVLFARTPHARGAVLAMAALVGSVMVSYTKARAESIGIECNVGMMERPERLICLIAGAVLDLLEPALWVLAILANITALQRIAFTRRAMRDSALLLLVVLALIPVTALAGPRSPRATHRSSAPPPIQSGARAVTPDVERVWAEAIVEYQRGNTDPVLREFASEAARTSPIADYLGFVLADALAREGDLAAARKVVTGIADGHADSLLAPEALLEAATLAARAGDDEGAQAALKRLIGSYPDSPTLPEALYLLGQTGEARGQRDAAASTYRELRILAPTTGWADGAEDRLAALAAAGIAMPPLSTAQRLDRAERLLKGGVPKTASDEAQRIADESGDAGIAVRALRIVADASARLRRYEMAARTLALVADRVAPERRPGVKLEQARLLRRAGQRAKALAMLTSVENSPTESEAAEAGYLKGEMLEDMDRLTEAASTYRTLASRYRARNVAGLALWRLGWIAYLSGDLGGAEQAWTRVSEIPGGRALRVPALYWAGRVREQQAGTGAAEPTYRRVLAEAPRSYYGVLAANRVAVDGAPGPGATEPAIRLPADPREAVAEDPGFVRVELLRRIGLVEFALRELGDVVLASVSDPVRLYGASAIYARDERYHLALRILRRHFTQFAIAGHPTLPRAFWEMLYPFGWRSDVAEIAQRAGIDPFLVAAVIRQESSYDPKAQSPAGARGLMQLMPATAGPMARVRGLTFSDELLEDPRANLELGTAFLAGLMKEFRDPRLALAAYNAGDGRLRQWWKARKTSDLEAFVERIPFNETQDYVKRVMLGWYEYRRLYGPQ